MLYLQRCMLLLKLGDYFEFLKKKLMYFKSDNVKLTQVILKGPETVINFYGFFFSFSKVATSLRQISFKLSNFLENFKVSNLKPFFKFFYTFFQDLMFTFDINF